MGGDNQQVKHELGERQRITFFHEEYREADCGRCDNHDGEDFLTEHQELVAVLHLEVRPVGYHPSP